jgi:hypothetical protein
LNTDYWLKALTIYSFTIEDGGMLCGPQKQRWERCRGCSREEDVEEIPNSLKYNPGPQLTS